MCQEWEACCHSNGQFAELRLSRRGEGLGYVVVSGARILGQVWVSKQQHFFIGVSVVGMNPASLLWCERIGGSTAAFFFLSQLQWAHHLITVIVGQKIKRNAQLPSPRHTSQWEEVGQGYHFLDFLLTEHSFWESGEHGASPTSATYLNQSTSCTHSTGEI